MSNKRILFFTVASLVVLVMVGRYGADEAPEVTSETTGDLSQLSDQPRPEPLLNTQTEAVQATSATPSPQLTPEETKKLALLRSVIKSGKDNDPRVDTELKDLSPAFKTALRSEYQKLPKEHRNGRGFIAFLIGRSLNEPADVQFLAQVVSEPPCLSFKDCDAKGPMYEEAEEHSTQTTLDYPQIVAARMLKQNRAKAPPQLRGPIDEALSASRF